MISIRYVDALNKYYGAMGNPPYRWSINETAPLHRLTKPLRECAVALLTSGGVSQTVVPAFNPDARNDHRLDEIPPDTPSNDFQVHDSYYDHTDAETDINCIFPLDRLRELAILGEIGTIAPRLWSGFMGRIYNRSKIRDESGPAFVDALEADNVDVLVAAPT
ncbi:MAG: glycine/sarcosine/betaine reductase selenoprotein B family protein [Gammaproteobacteria bacterium]|nr:glycine/sarcosine/betaine reductase selenoprotein B family protein [Gammaproteobacteria bacterium]